MYMDLVNALGLLGLPLNTGINELENAYKRCIGNESIAPEIKKFSMAYNLIKDYLLTHEELTASNFKGLIPGGSFDSAEYFLGSGPKSAIQFLAKLYQYLEKKIVLTPSEKSAVYPWTNYLDPNLDLDKETTFYLHLRIFLYEDELAEDVFKKSFNFADFLYWVVNNHRTVFPTVFSDKNQALNHHDSSLSYISNLLDSFQSGVLYGEKKLYKVPRLIPGFVVYQISNITPRNFFLGLIKPANLLPCVTHYFTDELDPISLKQTEMLVKLHDDPWKCPITYGETYPWLIYNELAKHTDSSSREKINSLEAALTKYPLNKNQNYLMQFIQPEIEQCCAAYRENTRFFSRTHHKKSIEIVEKLRQERDAAEKIKIILSFHTYLLKYHSHELLEKIESLLLKVFTELAKPLYLSRTRSLNILRFLQEQGLLKEDTSAIYVEQPQAYTTFSFGNNERLLLLEKLLSGSSRQIEVSRKDHELAEVSASSVNRYC